MKRGFQASEKLFNHEKHENHERAVILREVAGRRIQKTPSHAKARRREAAKKEAPYPSRHRYLHKRCVMVSDDMLFSHIPSSAAGAQHE